MNATQNNAASTAKMIFRLYWKNVAFLLVAFIAQMILPLRQAPEVLSNGLLAELYQDIVIVLACWGGVRTLFNTLRLIRWLRGKGNACRNCGGIMSLSRPAPYSEETMISTCYRCSRERVTRDWKRRD